MTLVEFVLARITEDEEVARAAIEKADAEWEYESRLGQLWTVQNDEARIIHMPALRSPLGHHIARHDPARVLAGCERDRRIVAEHVAGESTESWVSCQTCAQWKEGWPCTTLKALATVYADHPDYDPAWR